MQFLEASSRIRPKNWDHAENTLFQWGLPFFEISPGTESFYDGGRKLIHLWAGEVISANLSTGEATGVHLTGILGQDV